MTRVHVWPKAMIKLHPKSSQWEWATVGHARGHTAPTRDESVTLLGGMGAVARPEGSETQRSNWDHKMCRPISQRVLTETDQMPSR